jgi:probable phosphoglycerate mutase
MARTKQAPPSSTLFLLVRHGLTPTTGKVLPARRGLHLAEAGHAQAQAAAERIAALKQVDAVYSRRSSVLARRPPRSARHEARRSRSTRACSSATSATGPASN